MSKNNMYDDYIYNQERNNDIADHLEEYVRIVSSLFIIEGKSEDEVKWAMKKVKKACKDLRAGKPEKVFDIEKFASLYSDWG